VNLRPRRPDAPDINLTPLIDVVFLLLIFFMVSTTFKDDSRIKVQLPEAQGQETPADGPRVLEILSDRDGDFFVNERQVASRESAALKKIIAEAAQDDPDLPVVIKADAMTPHQAVITAMDVASQLGHRRFSFAASRPGDGP